MSVLSTPEIQTISWGSQMRVLVAVARKDWQQYWRYPLNAVSAILQPIVWMVPVYFLGKAFSVNGEALGFAAYSGTSDYMSFYLVGLILGSFINAVFWGMGFSMKADMDAGVLESTWLTPAARPLLLVGRTFTSLLVTSLTTTGALLLAGLIFGFRPTGSFLWAFVTLVPLLIGLYGFGLAFAALVLLMRDANMMVDVSSFLVQIFSGSEFPVRALPAWLLPVSLALPLTYGYDALRGWLLHTHTLLPLPVEAGLLVVFMFAMIAFGLWALDALDRHVRRLGTLGQH